MSIPRLALAALCLSVAACSPAQQDIDPPPAEDKAVMTGRVTDLAAFDRFISGRPTPEQFRARYPDVMLALPGAITTKEFRTDNSRYFAELDTEGRVSGGRFE